MEYNTAVKQSDGYYYFPQSKKFPYKTKNLRDPYLSKLLLI